MVPLAHPFGQALGGETAGAVWLAHGIFRAVLCRIGDLGGKGLHPSHAHGEHVAVTGEPIRMLPLVLKMVLLVTEVENLHLYALGKPASGQLVQDRSGTPDEYAGIACPPIVSPLEDHLEVLVDLG